MYVVNGRVQNARAYDHRLYDWSGLAHVQGLHCHACAVLTSCYLPGHKCCGRCQLDGSSFFNLHLHFPMGGMNGLWAYSQVCR